MLYDELGEKVNFFTKEELKFLEIEEDYKTFTMFRLMTFIGARKRKIFALHWSDIDFANRSTTFKRTLLKQKENNYFRRPKQPLHDDLLV